MCVCDRVFANWCLDYPGLVHWPFSLIQPNYRVSSNYMPQNNSIVQSIQNDPQFFQHDIHVCNYHSMQECPDTPKQLTNDSST